MTEDITSLQIRILYDKVEAAEKKLDALNKTGTKTGKTVEGLGSKFGTGLKSLYAFATGAAVVTASIAAMKAIIDKTAEFQKLKAGLITATGSAENAAVAFEALQDYAQSTPSSLIEVTEAFTKLVNYGLTPSERALTAYGNTASAMGKSLNQMVEAVADATTGEFERLKEFGIKAKTEGDNITFRFRGVSTTVKNTASEIEKYLIGLSEKNFGGAMEEQMKTLNGLFSSLGDEWDKLLANIGENGLGDAAGGGIQMVIDLLAELNAMIASGELQANINAWTIGWQEFGGAVGESFSEIFDSFQGMTAGISASGEGLVTDLIEHFQRLPLKWKAAAEIIGSVMFALVDSAVQVAGAIYESFRARFDQLVNTAVITGRGVADALASPLDAIAIGEKALADVAGQAEKTAARIAKANEQAAAKIKINFDSGLRGVTDALGDYNKGVEKIEAATKKGEEARAKYEAELAKRKASGKDRLEGFGVGVDTQGNGKAKKSGGGGGGGMSDAQREWESLEKELRDQETLISESYERRFKLIEENTRQGSAYQAELEISLTEKFEEEQMRRIDKLKEMPEKMFEAFAAEEALIEESYERRKEIILNATELTEAERLKMLNEAELQYTHAMRKHETERNKIALGLASDFFGNIATIAGAFGKKGAKIAKAAAIAETTVKTYQAATSAYASLAGIPYVGPALGVAAAAAAVAAGMANIQKIRSTDDSGGYAGAYATGGIVPGTSYTGDRLTASVNSGEAIFNKGQQKQLWDMANGRGGAGGGTEVNIINMTGQPVTQSRTMDGDKERLEFIIGQTREAIANDIAKGGTKVARAMERTYNMTRGKSA